MFLELRKLVAKEQLDDRTELERVTDALVNRHLSQVDERILRDASRMGEFYRMFYAIENDIRDFISSTLEEEYGRNWWGEKVPEEIRKNVKEQKKNEDAEGLPPRSQRRIDYTSFGELGEIIKANWEVFRGVFSGATIDRFQRVMRRLNIARGPIAHSGIVDPEESVRLKLAIRDWYALME